LPFIKNLVSYSNGRFHPSSFIPHPLTLSSLDWAIIIAYNILSLVVGIVMTKRAHKSTEEYFLAGRALPWWIAGTSMVATSFSCDTPLYVTKLVRTVGIYENWQWWCFGIGSLFGTFFLAPLWRRAKVLTDIELTELRYGKGTEAKLLRGFRALWLALPINVIAMGWVILAMAKINHEALGWTKLDSIWLFTGLTFCYTLLSGMWGVALTDLVQYIIAQGGAIIFAFYAVNHAGGLESVLNSVRKVMEKPDMLEQIPQAGWGGMFTAEFWTPAFTGFAVYAFITWWANVNSDGGGKVIQRQNSCKNEQHALLATLWYSLTNLAFRTWPWVVVALVTMVVYPTIEDHELAYPRLMMSILPYGLKGLLLASLLAAFMSTISSQLNWGASYLVHDFYRPFLVRNREDKHYIRISHIATTIVLAGAAVAAYYTSSVTDAFKFIIAFGAGTGPVYILRWFWWRINAWTEISAMLASTTISLSLPYVGNFYFAQKLLIITFGSAIVWLAVTFITKPAPMAVLAEFYRRTRPIGSWNRVRQFSRAGGGVTPKPESMSRPLWGWICGLCFVLGLTLAIGYTILMNMPLAILWYVVSGLGLVGLWKMDFLRTTV
jgi:Na+/proline symporter